MAKFDGIAIRLMIPGMSSERISEAVQRLYDVMSDLRRGCPWDKKQTHLSLRRYLQEECHEVLDALDREDSDDLQGELGDLLFQIWFHAEVASEQNPEHGLAAIIERVTEKLIRRHPHVFGPESASTDEQVRESWERIKAEERPAGTSRLDGLPPLIPALLGAQRLQEKAASVGFDWKEMAPVLDKISEEIDELKEELRDGSRPQRIESEMGDLLFALVNLSRHLNLSAEDALRGTNRRFTSRFQFIEAGAKAEGRALDSLTLAEMEALWVAAKEKERGGG